MEEPYGIGAGLPPLLFFLLGSQAVDDREGRMRFSPFISFLYSTSLMEWSQFKKQHDKKYESSVAEKAAMLNFRENLRKINKHNRQFYDKNLSSYRMAVNQWSDRSHEQFRDYYGLYGISHDFFIDRSSEYVSGQVLPSAVDWNKTGSVTPPQDQKSCGSCWAFAAVGALEAQLFKTTGNLTALSVQNLIDCSDTNLGCAGGLPMLAFRDLQSIALSTDDTYPYRGFDGACRMANATCRIRDFYQEEDYVSEERLKELIATVGPVTALIDASPYGFMHYSEGIYYDASCDSFNSNHAVLVIGYGIENGLEYWLIKNSWGRSWGMNGFMKIVRNRNNACGIANSNAYPIL